MKKRDRKTLPVSTLCRNCGARTVGRYCHVCGQDLFAGTGRKLRELAGNFFGDIFAWDNKVFTTLLYLVAYPGRLTKEFYDGRIARYVYPSKLFWFLSLIFFALLVSGLKTGGTPDGNSNDTPDPTADSTAMDSGRDLVNVAVNGKEMDLSGMNIALKGEKVDLSEKLLSREQIKSYISSYSPYLMFVLVPVFALLVFVMFKRKGRYYTDYLIFAFHFHSFLFLLISLMLALKKIFPGMGGEGWFFVWIPMLYLGIALRRVYRPRVVPMILKIFLIMFLYGIIMLIAVALFAILYYYLFRG